MPTPDGIPAALVEDPKAGPLFGTAPVAEPVEDPKAEDNGKKKAKRVKYPGLFTPDGDRMKDPATGKHQLLKEYPKDFRSSLHHPLQQNYFADETIFLDHKIGTHKAAIKKLQEERNLVTKYTNVEERKAALKMKSTFNMLVALVKQLQESGRDPRELGIDLTELGIS